MNKKAVRISDCHIVDRVQTGLKVLENEVHS